MILRPILQPILRPILRSPTAAGAGPSPSLFLDFTNGYTDPRITYSGGANGTRVNSAGLIVAATTPRFDYNPVTLAPLGLLVEEARTNLITRSAQFDNAAWTKVTANATVTADATTSPDGTANADSINSLTASGDNSIVNAATVPNDSAVYTASVYLKKSTSTVVRVDFRLAGGSGLTYAYLLNLDTGVIASAGANNATAFSATPVGGGWYRLVLTAPNNSSGNVAAQMWIYGGIAVGGAVAIGATYAWGAQLEAGSFPTSYIPTTSAAVTRSADSAVMTGTNFSSWYNQTGGTFVVSCDVLALQSAAISMDVGAGGAFGTTAYMYQSATALGVGPPSAPVNMDSTVATVALTNRYAVAMAANNTIVAVNGTLGTLDSSCAMPASATTLTIGKGGWGGAGNHLNGHLKTLRYYPQRLPNATLQGMTA